MREIPKELMDLTDGFELEDQRGKMTIRPVEKPQLTLYPGTSWEYDNKSGCWAIVADPDTFEGNIEKVQVNPFKLGNGFINAIPKGFMICRYDEVYRLVPIMDTPAPLHYVFVYVSEAEKPWKLVPEEEAHRII